MKKEDIKAKFPLHFFVWNNEHNHLKEEIESGKHNLELKDPRGRTPLMLCVTLGHIESARILLLNNANAAAVNKQYWSVNQEAICSGDPEMVRLTLQHRDGQRCAQQAQMVTELLDKLKQSPDFYVEMKWEFTSWLPLVSRMCPSDVCRVWKSGANVRIDTTLLGFTSTNEWKRGNLSYIFRATREGAVMDEVNHDDRTVYRHLIELDQKMAMEPSPDFIAKKLTQPIFVTYVDTDKIEFERSKAGLWGWRSDRKEQINKNCCDVFSASNVQIVSLRRTEHLTEEDKAHLKERGGASTNLFQKGNPLSTFLGAAENEAKEAEAKPLTTTVEYNPCHLTMEEYFDPLHPHHDQKDVGRPKQMTTKIKTFKAHLWLCQDYPLSLPDQVIPIIDLMAEYNPHFNKLKDFVTMQLPTGFPMKIEIPLYHILTTRITFGNLFASDNPVMGVNCLRDSHHKANDAGESSSQQQINCSVDDSVFEVSMNYRVVVENSPGHGGGLDEEEQMVQMALQHSLMEYGGPEAAAKYPELKKQLSVTSQQSAVYYDDDEAMLQKAIAASLSFDSGAQEFPEDEEFASVISQSRKDKEEEETRRREQEEDEMKRILELSMLEK